MRIGIVSDIHSNLPALTAVLNDIGPTHQLWCLGDTVGYGPYPNEVIELLRRLDCQLIPGNHDWGSTGKIPLDDFNLDARRACEWTGSVLTKEHRLFLDSLPLTRTIGDFTLAHGTPQEPIWEYMAYPATAKLGFHYFATRYCLVGHTHVPLVFFETDGNGLESVTPRASAILKLDDRRAIVNPGSVGQPRDGNPAAAYALYDSDTAEMQFRRVAYDIQAIQSQMAALKFPERLIKRLAFGW